MESLGTKAGRTISWIENLHINWLSRSLLFASQEKNVLFACKKKFKNDTNCFVILQFYIRKICFKGFNVSILLHLCALKLLALGWRCGAFLGQGWQRSKEHLYGRVDRCPLYRNIKIEKKHKMFLMFYKYILSITCFDTLILGHFERNKTLNQTNMHMQTNIKQNIYNLSYIWVTFLCCRPCLWLIPSFLNGNWKPESLESLESLAA